MSALLFAFVAGWLLKEFNELGAGDEPRAVDGSRGYVVGAAGLMQPCFTTDREFDLPFENRSPLAFVAVRGEFNVLENLKEDQLPLIRLQEAGPNSVRWDRNIYFRQAGDDVRKFHLASFQVRESVDA